jgi:hypothetical protein
VVGKDLELAIFNVWDFETLTGGDWGKNLNSYEA